MGRLAGRLAAAPDVRVAHVRRLQRAKQSRFDPVLHGVFRRVVAGHDDYFTQSEPLGAREIFPCIDEPSSKVPWQVTLDVPTGEVALANSPEQLRGALDASHDRVQFAPTPPLPSYLIAFAVGAAKLFASFGDLAPELAGLANLPRLPQVGVSTSCAGPRPKLGLDVTSNWALLGPLRVCLAFGDASTRQDRCVELSTRHLDVDLSMCPTWVLPAARGVALHQSKLSNDQAAALLGDGWNRLTDEERRYVFAWAGESPSAVANLARLNALPSGHALAIDLTERVGQLVPATLRHAFDSWVIAAFGGQLVDLEHSDDDTTNALARLLGRSGAPAVIAQATALAATEPMTSATLFARKILAQHDDTYIEKVIHDAQTPGVTRVLAYSVIARAPHTLTLLASHPQDADAFGGFNILALATNTCDDDNQASALAVSQRFPKFRRQIELACETRRSTRSSPRCGRYFTSDVRVTRCWVQAARAR